MRRTVTVLFILVMLGVCGYVVMHGLAMEDLAFQIRERSTDLNTNRQRERKQQVEYDQAAALLPENEARLAEIQPKADAAKATETDLRAQRKQLRAEVADLKAQVETAEGGAGEAEGLAEEARSQYSRTVERAEGLLQSLGKEDAP